MQPATSISAQRSGLSKRSGRRSWYKLVLLASLTLLVPACPADSASETVDAAPRRKRDAGTAGNPTSSCIYCSMLAQLIAGGGGVMDPCAAGMGGGPGGFTFCNETVFNAFTGCMQTQCAGSCTLGAGGGGGMMCQADGGTPPSPPDAGSPRDAAVTDDAGTATDGGNMLTCQACINTRCAAEFAQCGADK